MATTSTRKQIASGLDAERGYLSQQFSKVTQAPDRLGGPLSAACRHPCRQSPRVNGDQLTPRRTPT